MVNAITIKNGQAIMPAALMDEIRAILSLPVRHDGGFQRRFIALSDIIGIEHPEYKGMQSRRQMASASDTAHAIRSSNSNGSPAIQSTGGSMIELIRAAATSKITELMQAGKLSEALALAAQVEGMTITGQPTSPIAEAVSLPTTGEDTTPDVPVKRRKSRKRAKAMRERWDRIHAGLDKDPRKGRKWTAAEIKAYKAKQ